MKRLFVAVKLFPDENFLRVYYGLKKALHYEKIKWVEPENLHITLKFLGETPDNRIPAVHRVLQATAAEHSPFVFSLEKTGIFGSRYNPRVIWFGMEQADGVRTLGEDVLNGLHNAGFYRDRQNFVPHLTIGRIKHLENKRLFQKAVDNYKSAVLQKVTVDRFFLYQSILKPKGPVYIPLQEYVLTGKEDKQG